MLFHLVTAMLALDAVRLPTELAAAGADVLDFDQDSVTKSVALSGAFYHMAVTGIEPLQYSYDLQVAVQGASQGLVYEVCGGEIANIPLTGNYDELHAALEEYGAYSRELDEGVATVHPSCDSPSNIVLLLEPAAGSRSAVFEGTRDTLRASYLWEFWTRLLPERARAAVLNHATGANMAAYVVLAYLNVWVPLYVVLSVAGICLLCCVRSSGSKSRLLSALLFYPFPFFGFHRLYLRGCCQFLLYILTVGGLTLMPLFDAIALPWLVKSTGLYEGRKR